MSAFDAGFSRHQRAGVPVQAAQRAGAEVLFTEDMQAGRRIDNMVIRNPFNDPPQHPA